MKISEYLNVSTDQGIVVISTTERERPFFFLGASCDTAIRPSSATLLYKLTLKPEFGKPALVALVLELEGRGFSQNIGCLLHINWDGNKAAVSRDKLICPTGRLGQIACNGSESYVSVVADGQRFVDFSLLKDEPGHRYVKDTVVLLRYLLGDAEIADLEAAATEDKRTLTERELQASRHELEACRRNNLELTELNSKQTAEISELRQRGDDASSDLAIAKHRVKAIYKLSADLDTKKWPWCKKSTVSTMLNKALNADGK